jgi:hypothetical protein
MTVGYCPGYVAWSKFAVRLLKKSAFTGNGFPWTGQPAPVQ